VTKQENALLKKGYGISSWWFDDNYGRWPLLLWSMSRKLTKSALFSV